MQFRTENFMMLKFSFRFRLRMLMFILLCIIALFDLYWILRLIFTRLIFPFLPSLSLVGDGGTIYSICWTTDIDYFLHMNNGKYFKEMDFGRFDFYFRSGITEYITSKPWSVVQHAATIKYRRSINFLVPFKLVTKLVFWDERSLYFEQKFVSLHDGFVRAIATSKNTVVGGSVLEIMGHFGHPQPPECPEDVKKWIESQELTSRALRPGKHDMKLCTESCENDKKRL